MPELTHSGGSFSREFELDSGHDAAIEAGRGWVRLFATEFADCSPAEARLIGEALIEAAHFAQQADGRA